jgi:hypothetical protein
MSLRAGLREAAVWLTVPVLLVFSFTHTCWTSTCRRTFGAGLVPGMGFIETVMPLLVIGMLALWAVSEVRG